MTVQVGLLRAVNVGGKNALPMADLRSVVAGAGGTGARTYLQSGNVVFRSDRAGPELAAAIADGVLARVGFRPPVLIRTGGDVAAALDFCPYGAAPEAEVHAVFLGRDLPREAGDFLKAVAAPGERWVWRGRLLWLHLPGGLARSKLAHRLMALPVDATIRNLRTVRALADLAGKVGA